MLEEDVSLHEEKLNEIDLIQTQIISTEFKTTQEYELLRKSLTRSIKEVNWFWGVILPNRYYFVFIFRNLTNFMKSTPLLLKLFQPQALNLMILLSLMLIDSIY